MKPFIPCCHRFLGPVAALLALSAGVAIAGPEPKALEPQVDRTPAAINATGYALDPGFNGGAFFLDRFAGPQ